MINLIDRRCKLIVFDIGGVLAEIDKSLVKKVCEDQRVDEEQFFDDDFLSLQTGKIKSKDFLYNKSLQLGISIAKTALIFQKMIRLGQANGLLGKLKTPYLFASNINEIHFEIFRRLVLPTYLERPSALSYRVGCLKPARLFFDHLMSIIEYDPARTYFIDDKNVNLLEAAQFGFNAVHCPKPQLLPDILRELQLF